MTKNSYAYFISESVLICGGLGGARAYHFLVFMGFFFQKNCQNNGFAPNRMSSTVLASKSAESHAIICKGVLVITDRQRSCLLSCLSVILSKVPM